MGFEQLPRTMEKDFGGLLGRVTESTVEDLRDLSDDERDLYSFLIESLNQSLRPKI